MTLSLFSLENEAKSTRAKSSEPQETSKAFAKRKKAKNKSREIKIEFSANKLPHSHRTPLDFAWQARGSSPAAQQCSLVEHLKAFREALVDQLLEYVFGDVEFDFHAIVVIVDPVGLGSAEFFGENELELVDVRVPKNFAEPRPTGSTMTTIA